MVEKRIGVPCDYTITTSPDVDGKLVDDSPDGWARILETQMLFRRESGRDLLAICMFKFSEAMGRDAKIVEPLLENADPTLQESQNNTLLHLADLSGDEDVVKTLLGESKVGLNAHNQEHSTTPCFTQWTWKCSWFALATKIRDWKLNWKLNTARLQFITLHTLPMKPILMKLFARSWLQYSWGQHTPPWRKAGEFEEFLLQPM